MPAYDIRKAINKNRAQLSRREEIVKVVDLAKVNAGAAVTATSTVLFVTTPKNFVYEGSHFMSEGAAGGVCTIDVGITGDMDGLLDGGNANVAAGTLIAKAGNETIPVGTLLSEKDIYITVNNDNAAAKIRVALLGYTIDR